MTYKVAVKMLKETENKIIAACKNQDTALLTLYYNLGYNFNEIFVNKLPLLQYCIHNDKPKAFEKLLELGVDIEIVNRIDEGAALNFAAGLGALSYVESLVAHGADVNQTDKYGATPLLSACFFREYDVVEYLLTLPSVNVNLPMNDVMEKFSGIAPIMFMIMDNKYTIIETLKAHPTFDAEFNTALIEKAGFIDYLNAHPLINHSDVLDAFHFAREFGHKFDIGGCYTMAAFQAYPPQCFSFEGDFNEIAVQYLVNAYDPFYHEVILQSQLPPWGAMAYQQVYDAIHFTAEHTNFIAEDYYQRAISGEMVIIPSGWAAHSIYFVIDGDRLYRANRGDLSDGIIGIDEFRITQPDHLSPYIISYMLIAEGEPDFLQEDMVDMLGLSLLGQVETPSQQVGNCAWTSAETAVEAAFISSFINQGIDSEDAYSLAKGTFLLWEDYDMSHALIYLIEESALFIEQGIYDDLLINAITAHHDASNAGDVYRGVVILDQLSEPTVMESFTINIAPLVIDYDPGSYQKISYLETFEPASNYDYYTGLANSYYMMFQGSDDYEEGKAMFDFLMACDSQHEALSVYQENNPLSPLTLSDVLHIPSAHSLEALFETSGLPSVSPTPLAPVETLFHAPTAPAMQTMPEAVMVMAQQHMQAQVC